MKNFDVIIIGGGASGCFVALNCPQDKNIAIIEKDDRLAKKLLVTGNGRCNITNLNCSSKFYNQNIDCFLSQFDCQNAISFFDNLGLKTYADEENRVYPVSNSAKSVVQVLNFWLNKKKIQSFCNQKVMSLAKQNDGFVVKTQTDEFYANKVVVATGTGFLDVLSGFNLEKSKTMPSLVSLVTKQKNKRWDGVKISNCLVTCLCNGQTTSEYGEVLFKENGLSGICIFNLSCVFARQKSFLGKVYLNLLPNYTLEKLIAILNKNKSLFDDVQTMLCGLLHKEVANEVMYRAGLDMFFKCKDLTNKNILELANNINKLEFDVNGYSSNNQVTNGGIKLDCLTSNLESKQSKNLFFCGEICDVDGNCGGYNLQWAWTSGFIVAKGLGQ